ncbi:hypothetical protein ACFZC7_14840 [Streptomyces massasporeus]|uniref:hypothetical protein n=1 Tax=Streptomyces massasporeus TaxID=67324 RepID=UPI0036E3D847
MTGRPVRVLLAEDQGMLRGALALLEAGATGFLVKDGPVEELAAAIRRVLAGETVVDPALATAALSAGPNPLLAGRQHFRSIRKSSTDGHWRQLAPESTHISRARPPKPR